MKKLLLLLLLLPALAFAESDSNSGLDFTPDSPVAGQATITGRTAGNNSTTITIPSTVTASGTAYNVTSIGGSALPIPEIPQQSLPKVIRTDGTLPVASISIGASSNGGEASSTSFTVDDDVTLTSKVYPESDDLGKEGELYVVMRSVIDGQKVFTALNEDGNWETWNASLKSLPAAAYVDSLEEEEEILIYSGTMTLGDRLFYVGYSLFTAEGKPVITTTESPFKIVVSG